MENQFKKISVIIVTYQSGEILVDCLNSVQRFFPNDEIIVVDNHPEDVDIKEYKTLFPNVYFISNPENSGFGGGNNFGADQSQGDILFFLNPDTVIEEFDRAAVLKQFEKSEDSITGFPLFYPDGSFCKPLKYIPEIDFILPKKLYGSLYKRIFSKDQRISRRLYISGAAFMIKKKLFNEADQFDQRYFLFFEENDLRSSLILKKKYNPTVLSKGFKIIHHEGKSYNKNGISWYADSLRLYARKFGKKYLIPYKRFCVSLSLFIGNLRGKDGDSKRILLKELKRD
ncbi:MULTISPECIES: glycosyltransferase family 2 protein [unclassified Oceanispirochaeta]|uniref:glycosyltransferase family 2 protein n=1 Tax=unclassified Oceanispirochaeta TaxID=2635722 RepID=UPI000E094E9E|nr:MULTISPECIES: glycosyltransferase family 2 protein [unclassified Oceanispirochaeta]MBF9017765.1 glycosyltransferase family 2 protein [Oceanispirochaeta sp. M2]NPD74329.1 glycosyltransferase family 2 protein [Oceanispirochaeta sp. M1]RDG29809.1 glycosyltransferase family 2 protein [Oceanispirochaeta sp. M1]